MLDGKEIKFDRPVQTATAISAVSGINRTTITRACVGGKLGKAAYRSMDTWLIDTEHKDFQNWLEVYEQQSRVKGERKKKISVAMQNDSIRGDNEI